MHDLFIIDIFTVPFADDIRVVHPVRINTQSTPYLEARRLVKMATDEAEHLTREIAKEGYAQNIGKAELPRLLARTSSTGIRTTWRNTRSSPG